MNWLDRLLGAPTMERTARDVADALRARGARVTGTDPARAEVAFEIDDASVTVHLSYLLHELQRSKRGQRAAVLRRFVDGALVREDERMPDDWETARKHLMPVLRSSATLGIMALELSEAGGDPQPPASRPFVSGLSVALVCDNPNSMAYISERQLAAWGVGFEQARDEALHNLRGLPESGGWRELGDGVWSGEWGDSYESSRVLLPDLIHRVGIGDPVAAVPFRDVLLLTHADNAAGLALIAHTAQERMADNPRWLAFEPLRLQGTHWQPCAPAGDARAWQMMRLSGQAQDYADQKRLLDERHEKQGDDIFVAAFQLLERQDSGLRSFAVWADGVDSLLPRTDLLILARQDGEALVKLLLPWDEAAAELGGLLEPADLEPPRFRARRFPDAGALARLSGSALSA